MQLTDGEELVLRSTNETTDHGAAYADLGSLLGARMNTQV